MFPPKVNTGATDKQTEKIGGVQLVYRQWYAADFVGLCFIHGFKNVFWLSLLTLVPLSPNAFVTWSPRVFQDIYIAHTCPELNSMELLCFTNAQAIMYSPSRYYIKDYARLQYNTRCISARQYEHIVSYCKSHTFLQLQKPKTWNRRRTG